MKTKTLSRKLARQQFRRMVGALILFTFSGVLIYLFAKVTFSLINWSPDNLLWRAACWLDLRRSLIGLLYYVIGYAVLIRHYWFKPYDYFQELIDAAEIASSQDDTLVSLSPVLSELEGRLNQLKVTSLSNLRAAREAEQRKNDLVTYLAHDLKTPITSVIGYLTLLRDEPQISAEMQRRYMNIALDKAERLDDLINEFFEITRFNLTHISLEKRQINLSLMLQQLLYEFQPMLTDKKLTCTLDMPETLSMRCDPDKLQRVFDNLLRNAVNYSFEGSQIQIAAKVIDGVQGTGPKSHSQTNSQTKLQSEQQTSRQSDLPKQVRLLFENHGDTISCEKLDRLFEQFYRLDTSRSTKSGGAGLGLAIAKEIVELHGGTITAFSENDIIRFEVTLPL